MSNDDDYDRGVYQDPDPEEVERQVAGILKRITARSKPQATVVQGTAECSPVDDILRRLHAQPKQEVEVSRWTEIEALDTRLRDRGNQYLVPSIHPNNMIEIKVCDTH